MLKINLGCGNLQKDGYVNVDISAKCKPDIIADITDTPWGWIHEPVERFELDNLAEHIYPNSFIRIMNEANKRLVKGGSMWIRVPELKEGNLMPCFSDPTHVNYFTEQTFGYFVNSQRYRTFGKDYGIVMWSELKQVHNGIFLEVTLTK